MVLTTDAVIIGSGAGGGVTAALLAEAGAQARLKYGRLINLLQGYCLSQMSSSDHASTSAVCASFTPGCFCSSLSPASVPSMMQRVHDWERSACSDSCEWGTGAPDTMGFVRNSHYGTGIQAAQAAYQFFSLTGVTIYGNTRR